MTTRDTPQQGSLSFSFYGGPIWYSTRWAQKRHQPHLSQHTHHSPRECERRNTRISSPIYIERPQRSEAVLCINEGLCSMFYVTRRFTRLHCNIHVLFDIGFDAWIDRLVSRFAYPACLPQITQEVGRTRGGTHAASTRAAGARWRHRAS
jgi:hypothetical protein